MARDRVWKSGYLRGVGGCTAAILGLGLLAAFERGSAGQELMALTLVPIVVSTGAVCTLFYRMWAAIHDQHAETTPRRALARLFAPVRGVRWAFRSLAGFPDAYNGYVVRHAIDALPLDVGAFRARAALGAASFLPFVGAVAAVINVPATLALIAAICDAINALTDREGASAPPNAERDGPPRGSAHTTVAGRLVPAPVSEVRPVRLPPPRATS